MATITALLQSLIVLCVALTAIQAYDEAAFEKLLKRVDALEARDQIQKARIDQQDVVIEEYAKRIEHLENQVAADAHGSERSGEPETLRAKEANNVNEYLSTTASKTKGMARKSRRTVINSELHKNPRLVLSNGEGPVAFHATNDRGVISKIGDHQHILFEDVHLNEASGFHEQQGLFIAPRPGFYLFSVSIMSAHDEADIVSAIIKDGTTLAKAYAGDMSGSLHDQGSVTIVTQLAVGDEVWVSSIERPSVSEYGGMFVSFMGYLLYEM